MKRIKIISNPYQKELLFQLEKEGEWIDINSINNPNSKLISEDYKKQFFSFKMEEIVENIKSEYGVGEDKLEIIFKGTTDHYAELKYIIDNLDNSSITLTNEQTYLLNADNVLPGIIKIFNELKPIINTVDNQKDVLSNYITRFTDSSADRIPLCVIGNYSSGKSTFINALIGKEILPSGSNPVTARVFKITQLQNDVNSHINFKYGDQDICIQFYEDSYELIYGMETPFLSGLSEILKGFDIYNDSPCLTECIKYINEADDMEISPIIDIGTSFRGEIWENCENKFIILDTPGSNSASNINHSDVLDKALKNLTNGLPIYVCESNTLDSTDNMNLYNKIKSMPEIDSRFTMIVVNKADDADLPDEGYYSEEEKKKLLNLAIPRSMYSIGVYFVSSILGLCSKVDENLYDKHYKRVSRKNIDDYEDSESEYYTQLYNFNVMPKQIKNNIVEVCRANSNAVYTNSGLFAIENGIKTFAEKYAPYNKCQQSVHYLENIIDIINREVEALKVESEEKRIKLENDLDENKRKLLHDIDNVSSKRREEFFNESKNELKKYVQETTSTISREELKNFEDKFTQEQKNIMDYDGYKERSKSSITNLKESLGTNISNIIKEKNLNSLSDAYSSIMNGLINLADNVQDQYDAKQTADRNASENLLEIVKEEFANRSNIFVDNVYDKSSGFWLEKTVAIRDQLNKIVKGSAALTDDKKAELADIINNYEKISLKKQEFDFEIKFFKSLQFLNYEKLNKFKLASYCNKLFKTNANEIFESTYMHHKETFSNWLEELIRLLKHNIVDFNPVLSKLQEEINHETYKISKYQNMLSKITQDIRYIRKKMNWQENEVE